jgi:putative ubiquitin-RnfH superfamily antitoxin RatB of RatAB toxin-antitoxin module
MAADERETVEVVYALQEQQRVVLVEFRRGMTAIQAIESAGMLRDYPELTTSSLQVGIFGRVVPAGQELRAGDRVEIYRPLRADPRETRRRLAASGRTMGKPVSDRGR